MRLLVWELPLELQAYCEVKSVPTQLNLQIQLLRRKRQLNPCPRREMVTDSASMPTPDTTVKLLLSNAFGICSKFGEFQYTLKADFTLCTKARTSHIFVKVVMGSRTFWREIKKVACMFSAVRDLPTKPLFSYILRFVAFCT